MGVFSGGEPSVPDTRLPIGASHTTREDKAAWQEAEAGRTASLLQPGALMPPEPTLSLALDPEERKRWHTAARQGGNSE